MASKKLFLAVPVYGALEPNFAQCLIQLVAEKPCHMGLRLHVGDSLVARARNSLAAFFLKTDCTDLLFIDSDLIFSKENVLRIMEHEEDVVGGFYCKKQQGTPRLVCNTFEDIQPPREDGLQKVKYMGTGFLKISRRAFEKMIERYGDEISYHPDETEPGTVEHDFFSVGRYKFPDGTTRYLSEDWFFCQRWLDMGGSVYADTHIMCKHVGPVTYPLITQEPFVFGQKPGSPVADVANDAAKPVAGVSLPVGFDCPATMQRHALKVINGEYDIPNLNVPNAVILDIGANVGAFTHWARGRFPDAKFHCYEPDPENFQKLVHNSDVGVYLHNVAVYNSAGDLGIKIGINNCGESQLVNNRDGLGIRHCHVIDAETLPDADVIKIDTEGCELQILNRIAPKLPRVKAVMLEWHRTSDRKDIINLMTANGFRTVFDKPSDPEHGILKFARPEALMEARN